MTNAAIHTTWIDKASVRNGRYILGLLQGLKQYLVKHADSAVQSGAASLVKRRRNIELQWENDFRDQFFYGNTKYNLPNRVWKRHSALLVYHERVAKQQTFVKSDVGCKESAAAPESKAA